MSTDERIAELERRVAQLERRTPTASDSVDHTEPPSVSAMNGDAGEIAALFLGAYPVRTEQDFAMQCFISEFGRMRNKQAFVDAVWAGLARWMGSTQWLDEHGALKLRFIPSPARFLGFERGGLKVGSRMYMDYPPQWEAPKAVATKGDAVMQRAAMLLAKRRGQ